MPRKPVPWFEGFKVVLIITVILGVFGARGWLLLGPRGLRVLWIVMAIQVCIAIWILTTGRGS